MKFNSLLRRSDTDVNDPRRITFRLITPKIVSIWFNHELCFGVYTNRIRWPGSDKNAWRVATDFNTPRPPFFPSVAVTSLAVATRFTKLSEQWMFKLSTTNTHDASGSEATVGSMGLAKS